jgi:hypothetical protein
MRLMLMVTRAVRELSMAMSPVELGTKNHCAGEHQQKFTGLDFIGSETAQSLKTVNFLREIRNNIVVKSIANMERYM